MRKSINFPLAARISIIIAIVLVVCLVAVLGVYYFIASRMLSRFYEPDIIVPSPEGSYELVIREFSCLGGVGAELYIRKPEQDKWYNSWLERQIGNVGTNNYYHTFTAGKYYVEWDSNNVMIYYYKNLQIEDAKDRSTWRGVFIYELE